MEHTSQRMENQRALVCDMDDMGLHGRAQYSSAKELCAKKTVQAFKPLSTAVDRTNGHHAARTIQSSRALRMRH